MKLVNVVELKPLAGHRLWVKFSDGTEGTRDYSDLFKRDVKLFEPRKDQAYFEKVFISFGLPTWPNGVDFDAVNLQMKLREQGLLKGVAV